MFYEVFYIETNGRCIILDIECSNYTFTIANLYVPTKNFESEQIDTFQNLYKGLLEFKRENIILGDLNLYLNPRVDKLEPLFETNDN